MEFHNGGHWKKWEKLNSLTGAMYHTILMNMLKNIQYSKQHF